MLAKAGQHKQAWAVNVQSGQTEFSDGGHKARMTRLSNYLVRLFAADALALFAVALVLLFLVQCLRFADAISVKGQSFLALLGQIFLAMPPLAIVLLYVCLGIGLGRGLRNLQASRELHILHVSQRLPVLLTAIGTYIVLGTLAALLLAHVIEPAASHQSQQVRASIAADLVSRTLLPNRFAEVSSGVTVTVGGRRADGEVTSFFADDSRNPEARRTYIADSAIITQDELGYVLQLKDGSIQYITADKQFTEISFSRYDIALDRLTGAEDTGTTRLSFGTFELVQAALSSGNWSADAVRMILGRFTEGLRVIAICLFVASLALFPTGQRSGRVVPIEMAVLGAAFAERGMSIYVPFGGVLAPAVGSMVLLVVAVAILVIRLRVFAPVIREVHSA